MKGEIAASDRTVHQGMDGDGRARRLRAVFQGRGPAFGQGPRRIGQARVEFEAGRSGIGASFQGGEERPQGFPGEHAVEQGPVQVALAVVVVEMDVTEPIAAPRR